MADTKRCTTCRRVRSISEFTIGHGRCKKCRRLAQREYEMTRKRRDWVRRVGWPVALVVSAIYSHDVVDGSTRICYYTSHYGTHVYTVNSLYSCPMTKQFKVDGKADSK